MFSLKVFNRNGHTWRLSLFTCQDWGNGPPNSNMLPMRFQARNAGPEKNSSISVWFKPSDRYT